MGKKSFIQTTLSNGGLFSLSFLLIGLTVLVCGTYYDASDDAMINLLIRNEGITEFPRFYFFISDLLFSLYQWVPSAPWQGILFLASLVLANFFCFKGIKKLLEEKNSPTVILSTLILFYLFFMLENVMFLSFSRIASLLCISSIFLLFIDLYRNFKFTYKTLFYVLTFILGMFYRPNGGLLVLIFFIPFCLFLIQDKLTLKRVLFPVIILGFLFGLTYFTLYAGGSPNVQKFKKKNFLKSNLYDFESVNSNALKTNVDSLKLEAVLNGYIADSQIQISDLEKFTSKSRIPFSTISNDKLSSTFNRLLTEIPKDYFMAIFFQLVLWLYLITTIGIKKVTLLLLILTSAIICLGLLLKLPNRVIAPILISITLGQLLFLSGKKLSVSPLLKWSVGIILLLFIYKTAHRVSNAQAIQERNEKRFELVSQKTKDSKVFVSMFYNVLTYLNPLKNNNFQEPDNFVNLTGWITILPQYKEIYSKYSSQKDWVSMFEYSQSNETVSFLFYNPGTPNFLEEYFRALHHKELKFVKESDNDSYFYKLK